MISFKEKPETEEELEKIMHPYVKEWFFRTFKEFSLPQKFGIMEVHKRNNILISAPTGATKTLTAFLSILNELIDSANKGILESKIYCVYISPLKALSNDMYKNIIQPLQEIEEIAGKSLGIHVGVRTGDTGQKERASMLKNPPHILITTPESLAILLSSVKFKEHLRNVDWCVIDEIHALAENKRGVHLSISLERLSAVSSHLARIGLSATISPLEDVAGFLVGKDRDCKIIDVQFIKELDLKVVSPVPNLIGTPHEKMQAAMYELIDKLIQEHKTTLIFTNTRSATERVVHHLKERFPKHYAEVIDKEPEEQELLKEAKPDDLVLETGYVSRIGAHHGSLGRDIRLDIEDRLKRGELKCVVTSTSLELGIDIGYIDLVICLGSPKSVARFLQRAGRAGHKFHEKVKGRIIVLDRDDLVECSVLLKAAMERKIDRIHIPENCLDVLAQQIVGIVVGQQIYYNDLYKLVSQSYCYRDLPKKDFKDVIDYLAGRHAPLESRHIYAKLWYDEETGMIGRKGKMTRVIYMTNIGTIPDESFVEVKIGDRTVGYLDESFLEHLHKGDVFVLAGNVYQFKYARGLTAQVSASPNRPPTVPSWFSEMLPLSFDLALEIGKFRRLMEERFVAKRKKDEILDFIKEYVYVDGNAASAIYEYFNEQFLFSEISHDKKIILEVFDSDERTYFVFHSLFGRRVNDALSRAVSLVVSRMQHRDVTIGVNDNGFFIASEKKIQARKAFSVLKPDQLRKVLIAALEKTEILARRFRHCAARALMILRNYKGHQRRVGRQQVSSMILMNAVKQVDKDFPILKEARREVLEDLMDISNAEKIISLADSGKIKIKEINTSMPSPFSFNLVSQGIADTLKIEDKIEFLKRMHEKVVVKIALNQGKIGKTSKDAKEFLPVDYYAFWKEAEKKKLAERDDRIENLKLMIFGLKKVPFFAKEELLRLIDGTPADELRPDVVSAIKKHEKEIRKKWPKELREFVLKKIS